MMRWRSPQVDITQWHRVFAWLPRRVGDEIVWLEWVERKASGWDGMSGLFGVEYRKCSA